MTHNLSFVKVKYTCGETMARKGHKKVIYKVSFISEWTLDTNEMRIPKVFSHFMSSDLL